MPATHLLQEISRCNQRCIAQSGDIDPAQIAGLIEAAISRPSDHQRIALVLAEFIGAAMSGSVPYPPK